MIAVLVVSAFVLAPVALSQDGAKATKASAEWGVPVNGLQMSISLGPQLSPLVPTITIHLRNVGTAKLTVDLGSGCAGPRRPYAVELYLTSSSGTHARLKDAGPGTWACAGAVAILRVPIEPGADYWTIIDLYYYREFPLTRSPCGDDFARGWKPGGTYTLQAELTSLQLTNSRFDHDWHGTVSSNQLRVHFLR